MTSLVPPFDVVAVLDYTARNAAEVSLCAGQRYHVLAIDPRGKWFKTPRPDGLGSGWMPASYTRAIENAEPPPPAPYEASPVVVKEELPALPVLADGRVALDALPEVWKTLFRSAGIRRRDVSEPNFAATLEQLLGRPVGTVLVAAAETELPAAVSATTEEVPEHGAAPEPVMLETLVMEMAMEALEEQARGASTPPSLPEPTASLPEEAGRDTADILDAILNPGGFGSTVSDPGEVPTSAPPMVTSWAPAGPAVGESVVMRAGVQAVPEVPVPVPASVPPPSAVLGQRAVRAVPEVADPVFDAFGRQVDAGGAVVRPSPSKGGKKAPGSGLFSADPFDFDNPEHPWRREPLTLAMLVLEPKKKSKGLAAAVVAELGQLVGVLAHRPLAHRLALLACVAHLERVLALPLASVAHEAEAHVHAALLADARALLHEIRVVPMSLSATAEDLARPSLPAIASLAAYTHALRTRTQHERACLARVRVAFTKETTPQLRLCASHVQGRALLVRVADSVGVELYARAGSAALALTRALEALTARSQAEAEVLAGLAPTLRHTRAGGGVRAAAALAHAISVPDVLGGAEALHVPMPPPAEHAAVGALLEALDEYMAHSEQVQIAWRLGVKMLDLLRRTLAEVSPALPRTEPPPASFSFHLPARASARPEPGPSLAPLPQPTSPVSQPSPAPLSAPVPAPTLGPGHSTRPMSSFVYNPGKGSARPPAAGAFSTAPAASDTMGSGQRVCGHCGSAERDQARYCSHCGGSLGTPLHPCPHCTSPCADDEPFCWSCTKPQAGNLPDTLPLRDNLPSDWTEQAGGRTSERIHTVDLDNAVSRQLDELEAMLSDESDALEDSLKVLDELGRNLRF